jgi:methionyl aminopeptidase
VPRHSFDKTFKDGDIVNIDVTPLLDGWHGDSSRMYLVGDVPLKARRLVDVTYECLMIGIEQARPGARLGDIGAAIQAHAEKQRYGVVRDFCGHGLGRLFHDAPEVVHAARAGTGPELKPGMFFTIEPMINLGKPAVKILDDGWTAVTRDRSLSAQFEHSIGITEDGCEIFTTSPKACTSRPTRPEPSEAALPLAGLAQKQAGPAFYLSTIPSYSRNNPHDFAQGWVAFFLSRAFPAFAPGGNGLGQCA